MVECNKCKNEFDYEKGELEVSHKIPKYLGGTDKDGRELLCPECHDIYERQLLKKIYKKLFDIDLILNDLDRRSLIPFMNSVKKSSEYSKEKIREKIKGEEL